MPASIAVLPAATLPVGTLSIAQTGANLAQEPFTFPAVGTYTFAVPRAGYWKFVAWGQGGAGSSGVSAGASGAYIEITRFLTPATPVTVVVPLSGDTTITFADGTVVTAGAASLAVAGVATGGDVNLPGTAGVLTGLHNGNPGLGTGGGAGQSGAGGSGGAGAPANLPYRGSPGGSRAGIGAGVAEGSAVASISLGHALAVFIHS